MPYCLACGKLRDLYGGLCRQCATDMNVRKKSEAQAHKARIMRSIAKDKRGEPNGKA